MEDVDLARMVDARNCVDHAKKKKEEVQEKPKKRGGIQLIVDNKPKRKIKKENKNVESIIDDLNLLAKELH